MKSDSKLTVNLYLTVFFFLFQIIIKDYFDSHGDLKYAGGKGSGSFVIDVPKVQRKIKGSAELTSSGTKHKVSADLLWNADKDPKQKIHFETDSDLAPKAINSKYVSSHLFCCIFFSFAS